MTGALDGLRIIDCTRGTAGPRTTGLFADYGADVIRVEPPGGDPWRNELAVPYAVFNRGKRSIELDLKSAEGQGAMEGLLADADVLVCSWRPGVAEALGLGFDHLHESYPRLVYGSITGWGPGEVTLPGYESLIHAFVGTMADQVGHRDGPIYSGLPFASIGAANLAAIGILAALYRREVDGRGRLVETSLLDGALAYLALFRFDSDRGAIKHVSGGNRLVARSYCCADGEYLALHTGAAGAYGRLMKVLGVDDRIAVGESVEMGVAVTPEEHLIINEEFPRIFLTRTREEWLKVLLDADICVMPHLRPGEIFDEPQPRHNHMVVSVEDPVLGHLDQVAPPVKFSLTPGAIRGPSPLPAEHSSQILAKAKKRKAKKRMESPQRSDGHVESRSLLEGVRVLDIGAYYAGPYASRLLADLGADVIKLENISGDPMRGVESIYRSGSAGKRAIALNLKSEDAKPIATKLLAWADIVHHNMRPGVAERLGVGYEQARSVNPEVIYLHSPGWGTSGPEMYRQSFAPIMSGYVGVGYEVGGEFNPPLFPAGAEDPGAALLNAVGMLLGLVHRSRSGEGQFAEHPQLNGTMAQLSHIVRDSGGKALGAGQLDPLQYGISALDRLFETSDGWVCVSATADKEFASLCEVLQVDLAKDDRFSTRDARATHDYALSQQLAEEIGRRPTEKVIEALSANLVPAVVPAGDTRVSFVRDPANVATARVAHILDPERGHLCEIDQLIRVSGAAVPPHRSAPGFGEHTAEILSSLGFSSDAVATLYERGVVR
jgi:crotonobetainyl-CoA:carnitine CoA-transferase CaiB-like acyl-CoA transferase